MTLREMKEVLNSISYKKGWEFKLLLDQSYMDLLILEMSFPAEDVNNPGKIIPIVFKKRLSLEWMPDKRELVHFIWYLIIEAERHEAGHFFSYDGMRPYEEETLNGTEVIGGYY